MALKDQLKTIKKNNNETINNYHHRFSIQVDAILENNASPGEPQEVAILFIKKCQSRHNPQRTLPQIHHRRVQIHPNRL